MKVTTKSGFFCDIDLEAVTDDYELLKTVHELGGVMSDEAVKASAQFQDSLQDMQTAVSGFGRNLLAEFLPGLSGVMDGIGEIFAGGDGADKIAQGVDKLITAAETALPKAMALGGKIAGKLGSAILDNAPRLLELGGDMLLEVLQGLVSALPQIPPAAAEMFGALTGSISDKLPELIPVAVEAILKFVDGLLTNSDKIFEGAGQLLVALAKGIINSIPIIVATAPVLIGHLVTAIFRLSGDIVGAGADVVGWFGDGILSVVNSAFRWGADLLDSFIEGIKARIKRLVDTVKNVAQTVRDYLGFSEPKIGPLSNFHTYAPDMMSLYASGIRNNAGLVSSALNDSLGLDKALSTAQAVGYSAQYVSGQTVQASQTSRSGESAPRVIQVTVPLIVERREAAHAVFELYEDEARRIGVRLAKGKGVTV